MDCPEARESILETLKHNGCMRRAAPGARYDCVDRWRRYYHRRLSGATGDP